MPRPTGSTRGLQGRPEPFEASQAQAGTPAQAEIPGDVSDTFERTIAEGAFRMERSWSGLLATGMVGGMDVGMGVLALLLVEHLTGNKALAALAFGTGFIALTLAGSELFTENFLVPVAAVVAKRAGTFQLARLWAGTLVANLVGGWVLMGVVSVGLPQLHPYALKLGEHFARQGETPASFATAVLGGVVITLMTWMQQGDPSTLARLTSAVVAGFLLAAGSLNHAIVASLEMFAALQAGAPFGYGTWAGVVGWAIAGNAVGGMGLVTGLRLAQVGPRKIQEEIRDH